MVQESQIKQDWRSRGFSFGIWIDPPGQEWLDFSHDCDELFMLVAGEIELTMAGHKQLPKVGEEILIPAHTKHSVVNVGLRDARWLYGYRLKNV